ncbi:hypothetical protein ACLMAB_12570 [Brevibacillus laterosporus]
MYDLASLPEPSKAISQKKAEEELTQNMKLRYIERSVVKRDPETHQVIEERPLLDYTPAVAHVQMGEIRSLNWYIDADTGKLEYGLGNNGIDYDRRTNHEPIRLKASQPTIIKTKEEAARLLTDQFGVEVTGLPLSERKENLGLEKNNMYSNGKQKMRSALRWLRMPKLVRLRKYISRELMAK